MLDLVRSEPGIPITAPLLDRDPWLLNTLTGTIDLKTGVLQPHKREDLITMLAPVEYDPDATLALWDRFLAEAIPDADTRAYVQRCVGATIIGRAVDDLLLVCHGLGGTGKGTFLTAIQNALGDYAAAAELGTFVTARDSHAPQPDVARLRGRRMVAISEIDAGGNPWNGGNTLALLKRATGGDKLSTRTLHGDTFEFIPSFTVWLIANDRPRVPDNDTGLWRRIREIPFTVKFEKPDVTIRQ